jgi:hypothetical protein
MESIVSKANKILGLIKRICKEVKNTNTRRILYCALVRPKLEYASSVWSPYTIKHHLLIDNVQRRATKFILNYPDNMSYVDRMQKTNLLPLDFRREISDLILLFKSGENNFHFINCCRSERASADPNFVLWVQIKIFYLAHCMTVPVNFDRGAAQYKTRISTSLHMG